MTNAVFPPHKRSARPLEMIAHRCLHSGPRHRDEFRAQRAMLRGGDGGIGAAAVQAAFICGDRKRGSLLEIPVEMPLVRALHGERIAFPRSCAELVRLARFGGAGTPPPTIAMATDQHEKSRCVQQRGRSQHASCRARYFFSRVNRDHQRKCRKHGPHRRTAASDRWGSVRRRRIRKPARSAREIWRRTPAARAVDAPGAFPSSRNRFESHCPDRGRLLVHPLERFRDRRTACTMPVEGSIPLFETPRHYDRRATLLLRDQRIAQKRTPRFGWVPVGNEIRPVGKGGTCPAGSSRDSEARAFPPSSMILTSRTCGKTCRP